MIIKGNSVGYPLPDPRNGLEMQGGINMNGHPISGLNAPTANDQAANMGYVKKAAPRNLLDNSDFTNPVNQRGQTNYTLGAWGGYCIDRWKAGGRGANLAISGDGISLNGYIYQVIPNPEKLVGKTVTLACKVGGQIYCGSGVVQLPGAWTRIVEVRYDSFHFEVAAQNDNELWAAVDSTNLLVEWIALYEGEYTAQTLPEYRAKGYMVEALNCGALTVHKTLTLSANGWSSSTPYTQTVAVEGILGTDTPHYSVVYSADTETALAQKEAFAMVDDLDTTDGSVKFTCFEEKPEVDLTIQLEVNR